MKARGLNWKRIASIVSLVGVCQFTVLSAVSMRLYPGGSPFGHEREGYAFWSNSLSDLGREVSVSGVANPVGSALFQTSLIVATLGLGGMWAAVPSLFASRKLIALSVRALGVGYVVGMIAVALVPTDTHHFWHMTAIGGMAAAGVGGLVLSCVGMILDRRCPVVCAPATLVLVILAGMHFLQYASNFWLGGPWTRAAPFVQKLLAIYAIAWVVLIAAKLRGRS